MVALFVAFMFLFFVLLDAITLKVKAYKKLKAGDEICDVRFVPELGFVMADGGKPCEKKK
jgi:hypothetical protein